MVRVMLYYKTLRMASMKIQHIQNAQNAANQGLKLTHIHSLDSNSAHPPCFFYGGSIFSGLILSLQAFAYRPLAPVQYKR